MGCASLADGLPHTDVWLAVSFLYLIYSIAYVFVGFMVENIFFLCVIMFVGIGFLTFSYPAGGRVVFVFFFLYHPPSFLYMFDI